MKWRVVCDDPSCEPFECDDLEHAESVRGYFDSNAATGAPMECSPHRVEVFGMGGWRVW